MGIATKTDILFILNYFFKLYILCRSFGNLCEALEFTLGKQANILVL